MSALFERFVARLCKDFAPDGWSVEPQSSTREAYAYVSNPLKWQRPPLRPDLLLRSQGKVHLVIDTKYKDLNGSKPSAADLYQLTLYSMTCGEGRAIPARLLYPAESKIPPETVLDFVGIQGKSTLGRVLVTGLPLVPIARALRLRDKKQLRSEVEKMTNVPSHGNHHHRG